MSNRLQNLFNEYNRRKIEIENNEKIMKDVIGTIKAIKTALPEDTINVINSYHPNLLDLLEVENFNDLSKIEDLKTNLNFVIEELFTAMERDLM